jgi:hypothetical protein
MEFEVWLRILKKIKVGYYPLSRDLSHPGDRRRLGFWASRRNIELFLYPETKMDVIVVSEKSDIFAISHKHKKTPIIYDLIDAYLVSDGPIKNFLRSSAKTLSGEISRFELRYTDYVAKECEVATSVVCSTIEQSEKISLFNRNVHIILDSHEEFPNVSWRSHSEGSAPLLWEGMPFTLGGIRDLKHTLESQRSLSINLVTDTHYYKLLGKYFSTSTKNLIKKKLGNSESQTRITPWSQSNLVNSAQSSSMAVLPIDLTDTIQLYKAENRLLIMWRLGLPCLASPTLAYSRVAKHLGAEILCSTPADWLFRISQMQNSHELRLKSVRMGQQYLSDFHTSDMLLRKWDKVIEETLDAV